MGFTEGCREFELISTVRDHLFDDIGTKPFVVKFLHRTGSPDNKLSHTLSLTLYFGAFFIIL